MIQTLIGRKIDQTQMFLQNGRRVPVTEIAVSDNAVVAVKTEEKEKYTALQLGFGERKKARKSLIGTAKKAGFTVAHEVLREVAIPTDMTDDQMPKIGEYVSVDAVFKAGDVIAVTGTSKGKGFAGGVKRYGFRGGPKTHGQSDRHRAPGSIGQTTTPGRVYRGKRMAGRMGSDTVTLKNLTVLSVDSENKKLYITGLVPGHKNAVIFITRIGENKKFVPLLKPFEKVEDETKGTEEKEVAASNAVGAEDVKATSNVAEENIETPTTVVEAAAKVEEKKEEVEAAKGTEETKEK